MEEDNCSPVKDTWCTREQQSTESDRHYLDKILQKILNITSSIVKIPQKAVLQSSISPCQHTTFTCPGKMKEYNRTWRPWPNLLRKCGWRAAFCTQSPPIRNMTTLHSFGLQHSLRRSVSNSKRLPKLSTGRNTVVVMATRCELDGPGIACWWGRDFPHPSRPDLGPTQPSVQGVTGLFPGEGGKWSRDVALTTYFH